MQTIILLTANPKEAHTIMKNLTKADEKIEFIYLNPPYDNFDSLAEIIGHIIDNGKENLVTLLTEPRLTQEELDSDMHSYYPKYTTTKKLYKRFGKKCNFIFIASPIFPLRCSHIAFDLESKYIQKEYLLRLPEITPEILAKLRGEKPGRIEKKIKELTIRIPIDNDTPNEEIKDILFDIITAVNNNGYFVKNAEINCEKIFDIEDQPQLKITTNS